MIIGIYLYIAVLGLILGSFYNVVGLRIPNRESIVRPPSHCPNCQHRLTPLELIPVFSYIALGGKCRNCRSKISPIYPFFEALTAALFVFVFYHVGFDWNLLIAWSLISLLIIISISDIHTQLIPDRVLIFFFLLIGVSRILIPTDPWYDAYLGAVVGFLLLLILAVISRGGMGGGDIKLYAVLGLALGYQNTILSLLLAAFLGTIVGLILMLLGKIKRGIPFAFGPFIALGALLAYFYGDSMIEWYVTTFFY
ncbi:prepilin peptidase [Allobacillus sp. GCM10007491]|uniref:Prepilin peptidase n=1 Tax=Allobacillus saliphilus TaxID=2912308 RepID=A0A941CWF9_9BACI|nr:A24 family peptidase [Allobacillus saliphilus]MBR7554444.1 prepilin peptidase [Allobacillus saliphilus]